jgi:hypothetical protein
MCGWLLRADSKCSASEPISLYGERWCLARLSNCGKFLRAFATASAWKHSSVHQGNDLGYGKNARDWIIRSQVLRVLSKGPMDAVQRLDGSRFLYNVKGLKI